MSEGHDRFECPGCHKRFRWNAEIAGRKVRCTACNLKMVIPAGPGKVAKPLEPLPGPPSAPAAATPADEGYELSVDDKPAHRTPAAHAPGGKCPSCNTAVKSGAVICINCGFNLQAGTRIQTRVDADAADASAPGSRPPSSAPLTGASAAAALAGSRSGIAAALENREDDAQHNPLINLWLPLGLIILGLGFNFAQQMYFSGSAIQGAVVAAIAVGIELVIQVPLLLIAIVLAARLLDLTFGPIGQGLFKLIAVALGPAAIGAIVGHLIGGGLIGWFVGDFALAFILFWILLAVLFDLEGLDTLMVIFVIWGVQWVGGFLMLIILATIFV